MDFAMFDTGILVPSSNYKYRRFRGDGSAERQGAGTAFWSYFNSVDVLDLPCD